MAKQYCRYCYLLSEGDCYYCSAKEKVMSESQIKSANTCPEYAYTDAGDIITGKQYAPRNPMARRDKKRDKKTPDFIQIELED